MPISFHCESCKQKIKAPDQAGGKWGSCPFCKHKCYIPLPKSDDEEDLRLLPVDQSEESRLADMMRETHNLTKNILHQNEMPADEPASGVVGEKELIKTAIIYLRQMADGELGQADRTFKSLHVNKKNSLRILASMARAERPEPELSDIPESVLNGLIRDASGKLS